ncbi:hypothetical protein HDU98_000274 [Podochytrium sp. JEL0797]|nr:hypothetical protein HDU98_000274 [Podochytrium sp. JEL0797]
MRGGIVPITPKNMGNSNTQDVKGKSHAAAQPPTNKPLATPARRHASATAAQGVHHNDVSNFASVEAKVRELLRRHDAAAPAPAQNPTSTAAATQGSPNKLLATPARPQASATGAQGFNSNPSTRGAGESRIHERAQHHDTAATIAAQVPIASSSNQFPPAASSSHATGGTATKPEKTGTTAPKKTRKPRSFDFKAFESSVMQVHAFTSELKKDLPLISEAFGSMAAMTVKNAGLKNQLFNLNAQFEQAQDAWTVADEQATESGRLNQSLKNVINVVMALIPEGNRPMIANYVAHLERGIKRSEPENGHDESGPSNSKRASPSVARGFGSESDDDVV